MRLHESGECPAGPAYGADCDGMGIYGPDPFNEEIYGDSTEVWLCSGMITLNHDEI